MKTTTSHSIEREIIFLAQQKSSLRVSVHIFFIGLTQWQCQSSIEFPVETIGEKKNMIIDG